MNERLILHQIGIDPYYKIWHTTNKNMIIYMHSDGGSVVCREHSYRIGRGVLCFVGAHKPHYTMPDDPSRYDRSKVFLSADDCNAVFSMLKNRKYFADTFGGNSFVYAEIPADERPAVEAVFCEIEQTDNDADCRDIALLASFMRLLVFIDQNKKESIIEPQTPIQRAIEYINRNIESDLRLEDIGKNAHVSKYYLCRQFKQLTGLTVMEYILQTRLIQAQTLLASDSAPIGEISDRCGFSSSSYFSRIFREKIGLSPSEFRNIKTEPHAE